MVDACRELVGILRPDQAEVIVVQRIGTGGCGPVLQQGQASFVESARRNDVVRSDAVGLAGRRGDTRKARKVAAPHRRGGYRGYARGLLARPQTLVGTKEESLVGLDLAAARRPELIAAEGGHGAGT